MNSVEDRIRIDAPAERTWAVLSDLTAMREYMPGVQEVRMLSESGSGAGATRHCRFEDGIELTERVTDWHEGSGYTLETTTFIGVPMRSNVITFRVEGDGPTTTVTQSMRYSMKGGVLAPVMERVAAARMRKALRGSLEGLREHVERG